MTAAAAAPWASVRPQTAASERGRIVGDVPFAGMMTGCMDRGNLVAGRIEPLPART
jgi:hypothetical protein